MDISGVILAGGANKRFNGEIKSKMIVGDLPVISRTVMALEEIFDEIIIVTNSPSVFSDYNRHKIVGDIYKNTGPLGGIHAALNAASKNSAFVFAGDMPFISKDLIIKQIECFQSTECEALIPRIGFFDEPLHAIYSRSVLARLDFYLQRTGNFKIREFLDKINFTTMELDETNENLRAFTNINTPADLESAKQYLEKSI